jgi:adenosine deaminase
VGLDSSEAGFPSRLFREVFAMARSDGLHAVAHAGEEGGPENVRDALDQLGAERIDHGVRALDDPALVARLAAERVPLTVCPLSNVRLRVVPSLAEHPLRALLGAGLVVTVNSDDPAYFGGYVDDAYRETAAALALDEDAVRRLAVNSFEAAFVFDDERAGWLAEVDAWPAR